MIGKTLTRFSKEKKTEITNIRNKRGDIIKDRSAL